MLAGHANQPAALVVEDVHEQSCADNGGILHEQTLLDYDSTWPIMSPSAQLVVIYTLLVIFV